MPIGIWPVVGTQLDWVYLEPEAGGLLDSCSNEVVSTICLVGASSCNGSQTSIGQGLLVLGNIISSSCPCPSSCSLPFTWEMSLGNCCDGLEPPSVDSV